MNFRTGDILAWRSTGFLDNLIDYLADTKGLHVGLVLISKKLEKRSKCGPSPSQTYVTFNVDQIYPIEEIVGTIWTRPNGSSLYHIHRTTGRDISENEVEEICDKYLRLKKLSFANTAYITILGAAKLGGMAPSTGYNNQRWDVCSLLIGFFLQEFKLIQPDISTNDLLPWDFYNLTFHQTEDYQRIEIFDKQTAGLSWLFTGMLIRLGDIKPKPISHSWVNELLKNYDYPRRIRN